MVDARDSDGAPHSDDDEAVEPAETARLLRLMREMLPTASGEYGGGSLMVTITGSRSRPWHLA